MQEIDFRAPLPKKETVKEKRLRVLKERKDGDAYLRYRIQMTAITYSVPLKDIHYERVIRKSIPNVDEIMEQIRRESMVITSPYIFQMEKDGTIRAVNVEKADRLPKTFYKGTRHSSWRIHRHRRSSLGIGLKDTIRYPSKMDFREHIDNGQKFKDTSIYSNYVSLLTDAMVRLTTHEAKMRGRSRKGSFFILNPYERMQLKKQFSSNLLRQPLQGIFRDRDLELYSLAKITEDLASKKYKEKTGQDGKKVKFKGKGIPGEEEQPLFSRSYTNHTANGSPNGNASRSTTETSRSQTGTSRSRGEEELTAPSTGTSPGTAETDTETQPDTATETETVTESEG